MPKVFVTQETTMDFSLAEQFGDVIFLSQDRRDDFVNVVDSEHNERLIAHLRQKLIDFDPVNDWLVIAGSPYVSAAVFVILGSRFRKLQILRWDNRDLCYRPLSLNFERQ